MHQKEQGENPDTHPSAPPLANRIDRLVWGAIGGNGAVTPLADMLSLCLPLCSVAFGNEAHYLVEITPDGIYLTACGGELGPPTRATLEPVCKGCQKNVSKNFGLRQ